MRREQVTVALCIALCGCESLPHPIDCATGLYAWANCAPGTAGYIEGHPNKTQLEPDDTTRCKTYGFVPGTDGFANCLMTIDLNRQDAGQSPAPANSAATDALLLQSLKSSPPTPLPAPPFTQIVPAPVVPPKSVNCMSSSAGNVVSTTCN